MPFPYSPRAKFISFSFNKLVGPLKLCKNIGEKRESHAPDCEILVFTEEIITGLDIADNGKNIIERYQA